MQTQTQTQLKVGLGLELELELMYICYLISNYVGKYVGNFASQGSQYIAKFVCSGSIRDHYIFTRHFLKVGRHHSFNFPLYCMKRK